MTSHHLTAVLFQSDERAQAACLVRVVTTLGGTISLVHAIRLDEMSVVIAQITCPGQHVLDEVFRSILTLGATTEFRDTRVTVRRTDGSFNLLAQRDRTRCFGYKQPSLENAALLLTTTIAELGFGLVDYRGFPTAEHGASGVVGHARVANDDLSEIDESRVAALLQRLETLGFVVTPLAEGDAE